MKGDPFNTLILAGGFGTRLGELGKSISKPLLKIAGKPILEHILESVSDLPGCKDDLILTNSRFFSQYDEWLRTQADKSRISILNNDNGDHTPDIITNIALTIDRIGIKTDLLIVGGDNFFDSLLHDFVSFSRIHGISTLLADVKSLEDAKRFSVVSLDNENRITTLSEKPTAPNSTLVTTCIYWFPLATLHYFRMFCQSTPSVASFGYFMQWLITKENLFGFLYPGKWYDIGTKEIYESLLKTKE